MGIQKIIFTYILIYIMKLEFEPIDTIGCFWLIRDFIYSSDKCSNIYI